MSDISAVKRYTLRFRAADRSIFDFIRLGKKTVETRAATVRYRPTRSGDMLRFACGTDVFEKKIQRVRFFKSISALLRVYSYRKIQPDVASSGELRAMYARFPGYAEKIKKFGIVAFELK